MGPKVDIEAIEHRLKEVFEDADIPGRGFALAAARDGLVLIARVRELEAEVNRWSGLGRYVRGGIDDETCETMARILLGDTRACDPEIVESADRLIDLYARKV